MKKTIAVQNLNAYVANQVINQAILEAGEQTREKTVHLAKVILRESPTHKLKTNVPLVAFVKNAGDKLAIRVLANGVTVLLNDSHILSVSEVHGDFTINGITYALKDTINGCPRYKVKRTKHNL